MNSHQHIDARALVMARRIVQQIDADSDRQGLMKARKTCRRWQAIMNKRERASVDEWAQLLKKPWKDIRRVLLDPGPKATRLRQNNPFCGVLSNSERWRIIKESSNRDSRAEST
jgi:hypothetical protein